MMTAPTTTMTGAELKVKLNGLGLAPSWLADRMGVTIEPSSDGTVVLRTYRTDDEFGDKQWPASWHRMLVFRVLEHFKAQGNTVIVEYW
jgi:hypothetical protein